MNNAAQNAAKEAAAPVVTDAVFAEISKAEKDITALKGVAKENSDAANGAKVGAYAVLCASLAKVKLVKGNLPRAISAQVKKGLLENAGVKDAVAKKYLENSVGLVRKMGFPTQATPELCKEMILAENLTSESKIAKFVTGEIEKDELRALAEKLVGRFTSRKNDAGEKVIGTFKPSDYSEADFERFHFYVSELQAARAAAAKAATEADEKMKAENQDMAEILDKMEVAEAQ